MHPGLQAPWFGLRLRRGNSLIGARRAGYEPADFAKATWWKEVPTDVALGEDWPAGYVHHFLLPSAGWGAVADTKEARELEPDRTAALKEWRKGIRRAPSKDHAKRLQALARRVEVLWGLARMRLELAEAESRRDIDVWGAEDLPVSRGAVSREQIEASLRDANGAYQRLRLAMDAWCAMWFWPVHRGTPPQWDQWVRALEGVLGHDHQAPRLSGKRRVIEGQEAAYGNEITWESLGDEEAADLALAGVRPVDEVVSEHPWLAECRAIADREGFFHWELDFAPVFVAGGFDLQVGNPPWVRPDWEDDLVLAEVDPWFALAFKPTTTTYKDQRPTRADTVHRPPRANVPGRARLDGWAGRAFGQLGRPYGPRGPPPRPLQVLHRAHLAVDDPSRDRRPHSPRVPLHRGPRRGLSLVRLRAPASALPIPERAAPFRGSSHH